MAWKSGTLCLVTLIAGSLIGCRSLIPAAPTSETPQASSPVSQTTPNPEQADAVIQEIVTTPVWVKSQTVNQETPGQEGMGLMYGDTLRTEEPALAEVDLKSGLSFRIGGNAKLVLQPNNQLNFQAGEMITWVNPGQKVPTEIVTPVGIAGLRGTTLFIDIPADPSGEVQFFAWEGTISIRPVGASEDLIIRSGEQLSIRPGEQDVTQLRDRIRRLTQTEILQRQQQSRLLNDFSRPIPTLSQIEDALELPSQ